jgi:hypothetical protein
VVLTWILINLWCSACPFFSEQQKLKKMKQKGTKVEFISEITGLSKEEIEEL